MSWRAIPGRSKLRPRKPYDGIHIGAGVRLLRKVARRAIAIKLGTAFRALPSGVSVPLMAIAEGHRPAIQLAFQLRYKDRHAGQDDGDAIRSAPRTSFGFVPAFQSGGMAVSGTCDGVRQHGVFSFLRALRLTGVDYVCLLPKIRSEAIFRLEASVIAGCKSRRAGRIPFCVPSTKHAMLQSTCVSMALIKHSWR